MDTKINTPSTSKVRRDLTGGKRGDGHQRTRRIRRPDPRALKMCTTDQALTGVAGLLPFGRFAHTLGLDRELRERFASLKRSWGVVYPMETQLRLLIDAAIAGAVRVFDLETLAADPLFVHLAGGVVPSIDTVYSDLERFDDAALARLEELMAKHGLEDLRAAKLPVIHLDIDTTAVPLFGTQEGAELGPNPRYHGRPCYHPIVARVAETGTFVGAKLRPGATGFGDLEAPLVAAWIDRVREAVGPNCLIYVRIDAAADCAAILDAIGRKGVFVVTKAGLTPDLCGVLATIERWTTVDRGANLEPIQQVAEVPFARKGWDKRALDIRVIAIRTIDPQNGRPAYLWPGLDYSVQVILTTDESAPALEILHRYNLRCGIEPMIGEAKYGWGIGKMPSQVFNANHAALLLKLLAFNLMRRFIRAQFPALAKWRAPWLRRALILVPGRLSRSSRRLTLHVPARSMLARQLN